MMTNDDINRAQQPYIEQLATLHREYQDRAQPFIDKIAELEAYRMPVLIITQCDKCHRPVLIGMACLNCTA